MATKHSKDHFRVVNGKLVHVSGHDYKVEDEFNALFPERHHAAVAVADDQPGAEPPDVDMAGLEAEFNALFADFQADQGQPAKAPEPTPEPASPAKPEPKPAPMPTAWTPSKADEKDFWLLHNNSPGHDKVYKVSVVKMPSGNFAVVAMWGKNGGSLSQQVKGTFNDEMAAQTLMNNLAVTKKKGGYADAQGKANHFLDTANYQPIQNVLTQEQAAATAPAPAPAPPQHRLDPQNPQWEDLKKGMVLVGKTGNPDDVWTVDAIGPVKIVLGTGGGNTTSIDKSDFDKGFKGYVKVSNLVDPPQAAPATPPKAGKGIAEVWAEAKDKAKALKPGEKMFMPDGTKVTKSLPTGKYLVVSKFKGEDHGYEKIHQKAITVLNKLAGGNKKNQINIPVDKIDQALSHIHFYGMLGGGAKKPAVATTASDGDPFSTAGHQVGETKVINGKTYKLNANHRWELVQAAAPAKVTPVKVDEKFPFTQVGPQAGSNPGGLYQDPFGKKWYIKFPATEDHAKNELLAAKMYELMGIKVPQVRLVKKDGKVGIASQFMEGLDKVKGGEILGKQAGVKEGFGADAWLANWDSVGLSFDNLLVDNQGNGIRIDPGGALNFRAQGTPKGAAFGNVVGEIDSLRDASVNPNTAAVFGKMTAAEMDKSVATVLEMPDDIIRQAVEKWGPGTDADKKALADKLIARKDYLAKRFPGAQAIAHPPKPDPRKLPVDPKKIPQPPDFMNWNGSGKGLSGTAKINEVNTAAAKEVHEAASKGDLVALKDLKIHIVDKSTGAVTVGPIESHPSQHVKQYWANLVAYMDVVANPGAAKLKTYMITDADSVYDLSTAFPSKPYGKNTGNIDPSEVLGYFMTIGKIGNPEDFRPKNAGRNVSSAETAEGKAAYGKYPQNLKNYIGAVQSSGGINHHFKGTDETYGHVNIRQALKEIYEHALPKPAGTRIWRWMDIPQSMKVQLDQAEPGLVFQNTDSMCCSKAPGWGNSTHFGSDLLLEIHYAEGAKAIDSYGSGGYSGEQEITTMPGQRFMILSKGKAPNGGRKLELLMLPPDPTFVASSQKKVS